MDPEDSEPTFFQALPLDVKHVVQGVRGIEVRLSNLRKEFQKEVYALERKYAKKCRPHLERRSRVIEGSESIYIEEISLGEKQSKLEDDDYEALPPPNRHALPRTAIPKFWLEVLQTHPGFNDTIYEGDQEALEYLSDIRISYPTQKMGEGFGPSFSVEFYFKENPFFSNSVLTKTYIYKDELDFYGDFAYSHVLGDTINWKPGENLIKNAAERAASPQERKTEDSEDDGSEEEDEDEDDDKGEDNDNTDDDEGEQEEEEEQQDGSFFSFFSPDDSISVPERQLPPKSTVAGDDDGDDQDEEDEREILLYADFDLGESLKNRILLHSVDYFTGDAANYEEEGVEWESEGEDEESEESD